MTLVIELITLSSNSSILLTSERYLSAVVVNEDNTSYDCSFIMTFLPNEQQKNPIGKISLEIIGKQTANSSIKI